MRSFKQDRKENTTTIARVSREEGRSPWRTFVVVVLAVVSFSNSPVADRLFEPADTAPPSVTCSAESSFDQHGVERWRKEVCRHDD